ncbi:MAG: RDD family protein [Planctomycetaceae bacterium]
MPPINWYYKIDGEEHGPVTSDDLRKMAVAGTLASNDLVRKEDMQDWVPANRLKGLEFANTAYDPYNEDYDPENETYEEGEYARARGDGYNEPIYAGFWLRFCAYFLDSLLLGFVNFGLGFAMGMVMGIMQLEPVIIQIAAQILGIVMFWLYFAVSESSEAQATPGKRILGIKVTGLNGERISFGRATGRTFAKYISGFTLMIGFIMAGFTEKKQALHDMIASCLVVKK